MEKVRALLLPLLKVRTIFINRGLRVQLYDFRVAILSPDFFRIAPNYFQHILSLLKQLRTITLFFFLRYAVNR